MMNEQVIETISTVGLMCMFIIAFLPIIIFTIRKRKNTATYGPQLQANFDVVTASQTAKSTTMAVITECNKKTIPSLISEIRKASERRESQYFLYGVVESEGVYLKDLFKSFGYKVKYTTTKVLTISWDEETTSMLKSRIPPLCRCKSCDRCHHEPETPCPKCETIDLRVCWL